MTPTCRIRPDGHRARYRAAGSWQATGDDAGTELVLAGDGPFDFCRDNTSAASGQPADAPPWTPFADGFLATHPAYPDTTVDVRTAGFRHFEPSQYLGHEITQDGVTFTRTPSPYPGLRHVGRGATSASRSTSTSR